MTGSSGWAITRDVKKTLMTKHFYTKTNNLMKSYPTLHC